MENTRTAYVGNGSTSIFSITFSFLKNSEIRASINGTLTTSFVFVSSNQIQFLTAPANGADIDIFRETDDTQLATTISQGSTIRSSDLNENFNQAINLIQEVYNDLGDYITDVDIAGIATTATANAALPKAGGTMTGAIVLPADPSTNLQAATKQYVDSVGAGAAGLALLKTGGTMTGNLVFAAGQPTATTSTKNIVQLTDSAASTSTTTAATPAAVKVAKDAADAAQATATAALPKAGGTMTGAVVFDLATQQKATTSTYGITQLTNSTTSTDTGTAATAASAKAAADLANAAQSTANTANTTANAALPKAGGTMTGNLEIGTAGSLTFEGTTADGFETTLAVVDPTADRTITLPNVTGTVVTTGDTGTVTSTMILDGTILDGDINASAAIVDTKLATIATAGKVSNSATTATHVNTGSTIVARDASGNFSAGSITASLNGIAAFVSTNANLTGDVTSVGNATAIAAGVIVDADVNASAGIVDTKLATISTAGKVSNSATTAASANTASAIVARNASGDFTAGTITAALTGAASSNVLKAGDTMTGVLAVTAGTAALPGIAVSGDLNTGIYSPGADQVAISTNGTGRVFVNASGLTGLGVSSITAGLTVATYGSQPETNANTYTYPVGRHHVNLGTVPNATNLWAGFVGTYANSSGSCNFLLQPGIQDLGNQAGAYIGGELTAVANTAITFGHLTGAATLAGNSTKLERLRITPTGDLNFKGAGTAGVTQAVSFNGSAPVNSLVITSGGLLGLGTSTPSSYYSGADNLVVANTSGNAGITIATATTGTGRLYFADGTSGADEYRGWIEYEHTADRLTLGSNGATALAVDSSQRVGIGTTSPSYPLHVQYDIGVFASGCNVLLSAAGGAFGTIGTTTNHALLFKINDSERARLDTSGRLLVGTSSARTNFFNTTSQAAGFQAEGLGEQGWIASIRNVNDVLSSPVFLLAKSRGSALNSNTIVQSGDSIGVLSYQGSDGSKFVEAANISAAIDGTPGSGDMPGRLVFSTTVDGAASPTEKMRITNSGAVLFAKIVRDFTTEGIVLAQGATSGTDTSFVTNGGTVVTFSRGTNDGTIISLRQDGTEEGTISVSGTTISYNGAHLSRWSQLPGGATREEILRGTVLSNLDEMCGWGDEDNEQLNRMKVSDVEGDKNVSGVFQAWDDDDDTYTDDFYCAMTGDFIIRIAEGVTVERGDLLMSAGDGTAKPQDDDIIRSKTIAKVTSTHVTCTYEDGSYCVPCVLMAC